MNLNPIPVLKRLLAKVKQQLHRLGNADTSATGPSAPASEQGIGIARMFLISGQMGGGDVKMIAALALSIDVRLILPSSTDSWLAFNAGRAHYDELLAAEIRQRLMQYQEAARGNAAVAHLGELQSAVTTHLTTLGTALEDPITRLIETASEAPKAAAEVIGQLRQEISVSVARDNALLEERTRIMDTLSHLLDAINHASTEQRSVIDNLVSSSAATLNQANSQFIDHVRSESAKLGDIAAQVTASAVDVASLGETFAFAVRSFNETNEKLMGNLQRIEQAIDKSMTRSDEQLAYYVAQAREIIDLSITSQKDVLETLQQHAAQGAV